MQYGKGRPAVFFKQSRLIQMGVDFYSGFFPRDRAFIIQSDCGMTMEKHCHAYLRDQTEELKFQAKSIFKLVTVYRTLGVQSREAAICD